MLQVGWSEYLMKAIVIKRFGNSEVLEIDEHYPEPQLLNNQVLIRVNAAGVNPIDIKTRNGELKLFKGSKFPMILGNDAAGTVIKCGRKVVAFKPGDEVYCMVDTNRRFSFMGFAGSGAYAEYCVTREDTLARKPEGLTFAEAAVVPVCGLTAYQALVKKAKLKKGDKILINGAAGGVGIFAVQMAKVIGAEVTAVCSERNFGLLKDHLDVDRIVDYKTMDFNRLGDKYDVVYDIAAVLSYRQCRGIMKKDGMFLSNIASPATLITTLLLPLLRIFGLKQRSTFVWVKPLGKELAKVTEFIEKLGIKPIISQSFEFEEAKAAQELVEKRGGYGKVVICIP